MSGVTLTSEYGDQIAALQGMMAGMDPVRAQALKLFGKRGWPSRKDDAWRYTDTKGLSGRAWALNRGLPLSGWSPSFGGETSAQIVFTGGHFSEELSDPGDFWQAASAKRLGNYLSSNPERAGDFLASGDAAQLLNTALLQDGIVISVPAGVEIDEPVLLEQVMTGEGASHLRHVVELGEGARLTLVEVISGDDGEHWCNTGLQVRVAEGATLNHIRIQLAGTAALVTSFAAVKLDTGANYHAATVLAGGCVSRYDHSVRVLGEEAQASMDAALLAAEGASQDLLTTAHHSVPSAESDQIVRAIAAARSKASFQGKVIVDRHAQHTSAEQSFKALVFDKTAEVNAKPELEIFADDVRCGHGATVGQLDEEALFYMNSRGVDMPTARRMLVEAFTADALSRIENDEAAEFAREAVDRWMAVRAGTAPATE